MQLPLPLYDSREIGPVTSRDGKIFTAVIGLSEELVGKLKKLSLDLSDTELQENSSDYKRFGEGSYEDWYSKERTPFALIDPENGELAAIAWLGPKPLGRDSKKHLSKEELGVDERTLDSGDWHTISFRSYGAYRGVGLMKGFGKLVLDTYRKGYPNAKIWTITDRANIGSMKLSEFMGMQERPESTETRLVMAEPE